MSTQSKNILVLRFSAMGDVALLAPVLKSFLVAYPNHRLTVATRPKFLVFFQGVERLNCFPADVDDAYSGFIGLVRLFINLKKVKPELVFDLHDHFRTRFLSFLFRITGTRIIRFEKGRNEKRLLTRKLEKVTKPLPHTVERYASSFTLAGFSFSILASPFFSIAEQSRKTMESWLTTRKLVKQQLWYGLAPFAAHRSKVWPPENYFKLIELLMDRGSFKIFLFGGGKTEIEFFKELMARFPDVCVLVAGELHLSEELALIAKLDGMICVDSSNMHLAALSGVPTISIWGGTHTHAGFGPYGNHNHVKIEVDTKELPCRPCSVYGMETCLRGDFACLTMITPWQVADALLQKVSKC